MLPNFETTVILSIFLTVVAALNPIAGFINGKKNFVGWLALATGLLSSVALGYLFYLNYHTMKFLKAVSGMLLPGSL